MKYTSHPYVHDHKYKRRRIKKIKYIAAFAFIFSLLAGGVAVWGTLKVVSYIAGSAQSAVPLERLEEGKQTLAALAAQPLTTQACLDQAIGLLSSTRLLTVPLAQSYGAIKDACIGSSAPPAEKKTSNI